MIDIVEWAQSKAGFYVDRTFRDGEWVLGAAPIELAPHHAAILRHIFTPDAAGRLPYDVISWAEPAKSGKTCVAALCALYMALHAEKNSQIIMASNKQNQAASLMFKSLTDSIGYNPHLPNVEPNRYEVEFRNQNVVRAIPSNSRGEAGARFSLMVVDEPWGYVYQDSIRLWSEFKSDPTRVNSVKLAIGYGGYVGESDLWQDLLNAGLAGEPVPELEDITDGRDSPSCWANGRHFTFWSHLCRQPWQTVEWIASQRASLRPAEFARMILADFAEGESNFVSQDAWEALIDPEHKPLEPGSPHRVLLGLDLATKAGGDDAALCGVYSHEGRVHLAFHKVWRGGRSRRADLRLSETVEPYIINLMRQYSVSGVWFDPYQALQLAENLRRAGLWCVEVTQSHASRGPRDTALYQMVVNGELRLYDHPDVRRMVGHARAKELGDGRLFLTKAGGKIDLLVALSNVASEARSQHTLPEGLMKSVVTDLHESSMWTSRSSYTPRWTRSRRFETDIWED